METSMEVKRIFVSHCQADRDFCARLVAALCEAGADVWWDKSGRSNSEESERELSERPIFVAVLSEAAFASEAVAHQTLRAVELYHHIPRRSVIPLNAHPIHYFNTWPYLDDFDRIEASERSLTALADLIIESGSQGEDLSANQANTELDSMPSIAAPSPYAGLVQREAQGVLPPAVSRFDRFTQEIRDAITLAGAEKQRRHLAWVGTEHLLFGIIGAKNGGALEVLYNLGVSLDDVGRRAQSTPSRDHRQADKSVFSANAKRALELATYEAQRASHGYLGTVHLLLGLVAEDRGTAGEVLSHLGITLSAAREETYRLLR